AAHGPGGGAGGGGAAQRDDQAQDATEPHGTGEHVDRVAAEDEPGGTEGAAVARERQREQGEGGSGAREGPARRGGAGAEREDEPHEGDDRRQAHRCAGERVPQGAGVDEPGDARTGPPRAVGGEVEEEAAERGGREEGGEPLDRRVDEARPGVEEHGAEEDQAARAEDPEVDEDLRPLVEEVDEGGAGGRRDVADLGGGLP